MSVTTAFNLALGIMICATVTVCWWLIKDHVKV